MLPFLKPQRAAGVIMATRKPDGSHTPEQEEGEAHPHLMAAAEDLVRAIHAKDAKAVASAMQACHGICSSLDSTPDPGDTA
jgi:hypothetical protein